MTFQIISFMLHFSHLFAFFLIFLFCLKVENRYIKGQNIIHCYQGGKNQTPEQKNRVHFPNKYISIIMQKNIAREVKMMYNINVYFQSNNYLLTEGC